MTGYYWLSDMGWYFQRGAGVFWIPAGSEDRVDFSDNVVEDGDGNIIGWSNPSIEREHDYPRCRPGFHWEQMKRTGERARRAMDHIFDTPMGPHWVFIPMKDTP